MGFVLLLMPVMLTMVFGSTIDQAFMLLRNHEWTGAAAALDHAYSEDPVLFDANNFHYLRGRVAENQRDWLRAREEFARIGSDNPLYGLASWHAARNSTELRDDAAAERFLRNLPADFPVELKLQLARNSSDALALKIYQGVSGREARFARAKLLGDRDALWALLRDDEDDDVALEAARIVGSSASTARDQMTVADAYTAHRQFDAALPLYRAAAQSPMYAAEARYQIARIHFQRENYKLAIEVFQGIARDFPGTKWKRDSEYQIAGCYWRLADYRSSEKAYLGYIGKYGMTAEEGAVRNLADVYRVLGEESKALTWIDRALAKRPSATSRQVMLFTKAKVLYTQKRYTAAAGLFQQLGRTKLRNAPGATTAEEVQYFQALSLSKSGNKAGAETIWRKLARESFSYYGQRAAEKLGTSAPKAQPLDCSVPDDVTLRNIDADLAKMKHSVRQEMDSNADAVSELVFLGLWDEASILTDRRGTRPAYRAAAEIAYMAGRYHRSVNYADRLATRDASTLALLYPAGYRQIICSAAATYKIDPLWLHAIIWQESRYNPNARSGASARGLMQLIPDTAEMIGKTIGMAAILPSDLYNPAVNIQLGAQYWASLLDSVKYPEMALAAYNGGLSNVQRWKSKWPGATDDLELFVADIGFVETKRYVMAVFGAHAAYASLN